MKKTWKKFLMIGLAGLMLCSTVGCGDGGVDVGDGIEEEIDETRTQLFVSNINGGYGDEWLKQLKTRFEALYADESFETDKMGVQVLIDNTKDNGTQLVNTLKGSGTDVVFSESVYYYNYVGQGLVADISDVVTSSLEEYGDTGTIEDKMNDQQKSFYKTADGKYYGIPHFTAFSGIMYDVDLFENKKFYFAADTSVDANTVKVNTDYNNGNEGFIWEKTDVKSNGPDGKPGTSDDGLPATYAEFFMLCNYIQGAGMIPITWTGQHRPVYIGRLLEALAVDYEGKDQMMLNYSFDGTAKNLVDTINTDGSVTKKAPTEITKANGYELYSSAGRYYALKFFEELVSDTTYYDVTNCYAGSQSHTLAQNRFLLSRPLNTSPVAMLLEGIWWENEADTTFSDIAAKYGSEYSRANRKIGYMPMPKATEAEVGTGTTIMDTHYSLGFINADCKGVSLDLAKKFLKFANTEQSLQEFTKMTNTPKALNYTMEKTDLDEMTYFGRSVWNMKSTSDVVYPYDNNALFVNQQANLLYHNSFVALIGGTPFKNPEDKLRGTRSDKVSAKTYFEGIIANNKKNTWESSYSSYFDK